MLGKQGYWKVAFLRRSKWLNRVFGTLKLTHMGLSPATARLMPLIYDVGGLRFRPSGAAISHGSPHDSPSIPC